MNGKQAKGVSIRVSGHVMNTEAKPLEGVKVEIWQACQAGSYNHPKDTNPAPRDPNFEYYSSIRTDSNGYYSFKTIIPGPYPADDHWMRPPHIHYKVSHEGHKPFITQLYFDGNSFLNQEISVVGGKSVTGKVINHLNELDLMLNKIPEASRPRLIVPFLQGDMMPEPNGVFNICLKEAANTALT